MEQFLPLILQAVGGAVGGNVIGGVINKISLGGIGNTIAGLIGGLGGSQLLPHVLPLLGMDAGPTIEAGTMDVAAMLTQLGLGAAGGGVVTMLLGVVRSIFGGR